VAIPDVFSIYNDFFAYGAKDSFCENYEYLKKANAHPEACVECKKCEDLCPQHLPITHHLKEVKALSKEWANDITIRISLRDLS